MTLRAPVRHLACLLLFSLAACQSTTDAVAPSVEPADLARVPAPPSLRVSVPNDAQAATIGASFAYDATQGNTTFGASTGLTYTVTFAPDANGLRATAGRISGVPLALGVTTVTIVARDARGQTATNVFPIAIFASGLATPQLTASYRYGDTDVPLPAHFLNPNGPGGSVIATDNTPLNNHTTTAGATLGRVLFYDARLSANDRQSCASCHQQALGFTDPARKSTGVAGVEGEYHAPALVNARFYNRGRFFWDERAETLEAQVLQPVANPVEMNLPEAALLAKLAATPYYAALYRAAFGTPEITADRTARALAQFVRALTSSGAKYDRAFSTGGTPNFAAVFTPQELQGQQLFNGQAGCARCHQTDAQVLDHPANNGLDLVSADSGAGNGRFKAPSLRNAAVRGHYMHDGRFTTLEQVVAFYNSGVQANVDLDPRLRDRSGAPQRLGLTAAQQVALVAYLGTLTDNTFLTDPRFGNPFAR